MKRTKITALGILLSLVPIQSWATTKNFLELFEDRYMQESRERQTLQEAIIEGDFSADFRLRYEDVNQDFLAFEKGSQALTHSTNIRYESMQYKLLSFGLGVVDNRSIPDDENYNSGVNNELDDVLVADPEETELNEAWLAYDIVNTHIKYGRQPITLDNGRFIGTEPWRQLGQSFSGLTLTNESFNYLQFRLAQLHRIEGVTGRDSDSAYQNIDASLFNVQYRGILHSVVSLYIYDLDNDGGAQAWDTSTAGIRFSGNINNEPMLQYAFEYAKQCDKHDNPLDYSATYYLYELGARYAGIRILIGQEVLGADGAGFFVTPLGNKHTFQGWGDVFDNGGLGNISGGIKDSYLSVGYDYSDSASIIARFHDFESEDDASGAGNIGSEFNVEAKYLRDFYEVSLKYSDFNAEDFGNDTEKLWLTLSAHF